MYTELYNVLKTRACPKCTVVGRMAILESQAYVQCGACHATHIDPFEIGPWETRTVESLDERIVSAYTVTDVTPPELEEDTNKRDFFKFMNADASKRVVEGDFPLLELEVEKPKKKKKAKVVEGE